jgi:hypothetical protein
VKFVLLQIGDQSAEFVFDRYGKDDQVGADANSGLRVDLRVVGWRG